MEVEIATFTESKGYRVKHLAQDSAAELNSMKSGVLMEATDPAPSMVALAAPHHGTAAVLLDLDTALGTFVESVSR